MARNPLPWLAGLAATTLVLLAVVTAYSIQGYTQLGQIQNLLTVLFGAFLTATIAVYTIDFLNEKGQIRGWQREEVNNAIGPIYEEMLKNLSSVQEHGYLGCSKWREISAQRLGVFVAEDLKMELARICKEIDEHSQLRTKAWNSARDISRAIHAKEFGGKVDKFNADGFFAGLLANDFARLLDGNMKQLVTPTIFEQYENMFRQTASGAPVREPKEVLLEVKMSIMADEQCRQLRVKSEALRPQVSALVDRLVVILQKPYSLP